MKMQRNKRNSITRSSFTKQRVLVSAFLLILIVCMSVGYAMYYTELTATGTVSMIDTAGIKPMSMRVSNSSYVTAGDFSYYRTYTDSTTNVVAKTKAIFNGRNPNITYQITVKNLSTYKTYFYNGMTYSNSFKDSNISGTGGGTPLAAPIVSGITNGQRIAPGQSVTFTFRYYYNQNINRNYTFEGETIFKFVTNDKDIYLPNVAVTMKDTDFDLGKDNKGNTTISLLNLYDSSVEYTLSLSNPNIELVDANGNPCEYTGILNTNQSTNLPMYFHVKDGNDGYVSMETDLIVTLSNGAKFTGATFNVYEYEDRPTVKPSRASTEYYCEPAANGSWANHYLCYFSITNTSDTTINQWTMEYKLTQDTNILSIQNWNDEWTYDNKNKLLKISSDYRYEPRHHSLAPGQTYKTEQMIFEMTNKALNIETFTVYADGEVDIFTSQYGVNW